MCESIQEDINRMNRLIGNSGDPSNASDIMRGKSPVSANEGLSNNSKSPSGMDRITNQIMNSVNYKTGATNPSLIGDCSIKTPGLSSSNATIS